MNFKEFAIYNNLDETLNDLDLIKLFLEKEYGKILPQITTCNKVLLEQINISKLDYHQEVINKYLLLIDGYHRIAYCLKNNITNIKAFILSV